MPDLQSLGPMRWWDDWERAQWKWYEVVIDILGLLAGPGLFGSCHREGTSLEWSTQVPPDREPSRSSARILRRDYQIRLG